MECLRHHAPWRKPPPPDSTPLVEPTTLTPETSTYVHSMEQAGIPSPSSIGGVSDSTIASTPFTSMTAATVMHPPSLIAHPPLTKALIYHMSSLSRSAHVRVAPVKKDLPRLIKQAIQNALASLTKRVVSCEKMIKGHNLILDDLTMRIAILEKEKGSSSPLDTLRAEVAT